MKNPYLDPMYRVSPAAKHVTLDMQKVVEWAQLMALENFEIPAFDREVPDKLWMEFVFWTSTINFAFTDFKTGKPYELEYPGGVINKGSSAMSAAFKRAISGDYGKVPVFDARFWKDVSWMKFTQIFAGSSPMPMMDKRITALRENGKVLLQKYDGKVENLFKKSNFCCFNGERHSGLIELLTNEFYFFDSNLYKLPENSEGTVISFNKRAQLLAMLYQGRSLTSTEGRLVPLKDHEYLSLPADYRTPQALRALGMIRYSPELSEKIEQGALLPAGSHEEMELRFQSIIAAEELKTEINAIRLGAELKEITIIELDYFLWSYGRKLGSQGQKHHLTETTAY
jgi:hypothetical protein